MRELLDLRRLLRNWLPRRNNKEGGTWGVESVAFVGANVDININAELPRIHWIRFVDNKIMRKPLQWKHNTANKLVGIAFTNNSNPNGIIPSGIRKWKAPNVFGAETSSPN